MRGYVQKISTGRRTVSIFGVHAQVFDPYKPPPSPPHPLSKLRRSIRIQIWQATLDKTVSYDLLRHRSPESLSTGNYESLTMSLTSESVCFWPPLPRPAMEGHGELGLQQKTPPSLQHLNKQGEGPQGCIMLHNVSWFSLFATHSGFVVHPLPRSIVILLLVILLIAGTDTYFASAAAAAWCSVAY